jgi:ATP-dependent helicase/DNAse subunit B
VHRHGELETVPDAAGTPSPAGAHSGGTGRIRDQALCPFRGYAIHRLALGEDRPPRALPDALDRGVLVHEALHHLYDGIRRDGRRADELSLTDFQAAAEAALNEHYSRFPEAFRSRERDRLINLLSTWNVFETSRGTTAIADLEETVEVAFDGIGLTLRIDRIDRLDPEGDALAVIDYKTGRVAARLNEARLVDPQLPIYALTNERIEAVLYAQVREDRTQLVGVSEHPIEGARVEAPAGGDWEHQKASWRRQLGELTAEIRQGHAAVAPYDTRACQTCHLGRFCRVDADFERLDTESEEDA